MANARTSSVHEPTAGFAAARAVEPDVVVADTPVYGATIDLAGKRGALFIVQAGTLGGSATVDAYLQDSDVDSNGNFANVNTTTHPEATITQIVASDGDGETMGYAHGGKRFVRAVLSVATANSDAGIAAATY